VVSQLVSRNRLAGALALAVVVVAALVLLVHVPSTLHSLDVKATRNNSYDALGRTIAASDTLDIDNGWAVAAVQAVRPGSTYAVVLPSRAAVADGRLSEITYDAIPPYMRYLLLPAVPTSAAKARYILCYSCGRVFHHVRWVWESEPGSKLPGLKVGIRGGA
jgi:hypothetical protein